MKRIISYMALSASAVLALADVFGSAEWIGPAPADLPLYSDYLPAFRIECDVDVSPEGSASIIYGLNDPRPLDPDLNIYNLNNDRDSSYIRVEIAGNGRNEIEIPAGVSAVLGTAGRQYQLHSGNNVIEEN